jgi:hypothetical protein
LSGKKVYEAAGASSEIEINTAHLGSGMYVFRVNIEGLGERMLKGMKL